MFRKLILLMVILCLALLTFGLVVAQDDEAEGPITYNSYSSDPLPRALDEQLVAMWNEQHPEMPVEHSIIAHEDFKQALRAYLTADPAPDVMTWFAGNRANFFIQRGLIGDFTDAWNTEGFGDMYAPGFQRLTTDYLGDDNAYFLPGSYYWWAIYYRPSLFEQAGIEDLPQTFDELLAACDALNEAGIIPITIGTRFRWTAAGWFDYLNMRTNGPEFHLDLMNLQESYTDERVKATFANWVQLFDHNCFIENPAAYSWQEAVDPFGRGEAAMYLMGDFIRDQLRDSYPDVLESGDLDFFQFPTINPDVEIGEDAPTDGWFIAANAGNAAGATAFMEFLGSQEVQQLFLDELNRLPTRTDVDLSNLDDLTQKGIGMIQSSDVIAQFYDRDTTPEMADAGMDAMMEFWDNPGDIDAILERLDEDRVRIAEEMATSEE